MWTGIPVSIGVAKSKVLAKISTDLAKTYKKRFDGYCNFNDFSDDIQNNILKEYPVGDIWGVGRKYNERLIRYQIKTAYELKYADIRQIKREFGIIIEKIVLELNGVSCIETETIKPKQQIMVRRSFKKSIENFENVSKLISLFTEMAGKKLRKQKSYSTTITVFISSNRFQEDYYGNSTTITFDKTNDIIYMVKQSLKSLEKIDISNVNYKRLGVIISGIFQTQIIQNSIFNPIDEEVYKK